MQFLADNKFDFKKLFYESLTYMSLKNYEEYQKKKQINQTIKAVKPFAYEDPECIIFCNARFEEIKEWL